MADPGNLCLFEAFAFDPATSSTTTASATGAVVFATSTSGAQTNAEGTWAVTAP